MLARDMRMVDAQVMAALQNGTAFFASTSADRHRRRADLAALDRRNPAAWSPPCRSACRRRRCMWEAKIARPCRHLRLCVLQVRLVVPAVQLRRHHGRRDAAAEEKDTPAAQGPRASRGAAVRGRRPAFQPRPARVLLRARLSRLVPRPVALVLTTTGVRDRDVAAAVRFRLRARLSTPMTPSTPVPSAPRPSLRTTAPGSPQPR